MMQKVILMLSMIIIVHCDSLECRGEKLKRCRCTENNPREKFVVDCSNADLTTVPKDIPVQVTHLILDNNNIQTLPNEAFKEKQQGLKNVLVLSIKNNNLHQIGITAFAYLPKIKKLNLFNNSISFLPKSVFSPVRNSLLILDIRMNIENGNIDSSNYLPAVAELAHLVELKMDIIKNKSLPEEYGQLKHLQKLSFMGGGRYIKYIRDDMFDSVKLLNITEVSLIGLQLDIIGKQTFFKTPNLRILDLSNNPRLGIHLPDIVASLKNTAVQTLRLNNTGIGNTYKSSTEIVKTFCGFHLKELILDHNSIHIIDPIFFDCFPKLEILSLSENYLAETLVLVGDVLFLPHLVGLNFSSQNWVSNNMAPDLRHRERSRYKRQAHACEQHMACPMMFSSKLQWIDISHSGLQIQQIPELVFMRNSTLSFVKATYTGVESVQFPMYCPFNVKPNIETVDVSHNALRCINESVFDPNIGHCDWSSIKYVYLGNNKLGNILGNTCNFNKKNILGFTKHLNGLNVLDISHNMIKSGHSLSPLANLSNLRTLDLSSNILHNFSLDLTNMDNLVKLNLSHNNLKHLSERLTLQLNELQARKLNFSSVQVDLSGNLLSCTCTYLYFFHWMAKTSVLMVNQAEYQCEFDDGSVQKLYKLQNVIETLEKQCFSDTWLKLYIGLQILYFTLVTLCSVLYRFRHTIKYYLLKCKLNRHLLRAHLNKRKYTYSAFVSCERRDCKYFVIPSFLPNLETEETQLKFCIAQRNFVVGVTILDNIMRAMHRSRKIVFIISRYFLNSDWCKEELRIAHQVKYFAAHCFGFQMFRRC